MSTATRTGPKAAGTKTFEYSVRDRHGKLVNGKLDAPTEAALVQKLRGMGYAPVSVKEANTGMNKEISFGFGGRVGLKDLAVMSRQFATMINSGLSLLRALAILADQTENPKLAKALAEVRGSVEAGQSLSTALAKHPNVFPPLMVNMTRAGEVGGFLDSVLLQIAANFEAEVRLKGKIKSAMTYPTVVFIIAVLAVIGMLLFIVPIFAKMFSDLGGELPAPTKDLNEEVVKVLEKGGTVLWMPTASSHFVAADDTLSQADNATPYTVGGLFQTDYWNYRMFKTICENNKKKVSPGTLGILTNPEHPIFKGFPTEMHTNWQWFPMIKESHPAILDNLGKEYRPIVQVIDNIERNHKLGLIFEFQIGNRNQIVRTCIRKNRN